MKTLKFYKFAALAVILIMAFSMPMAAKKKNEAKIDFKETIYDFGKISAKGGKVSHEFAFTNEGDTNLIIIDAKADCGCTKPEYSEAPIAPGKSSTIKITYVPNGSGHFTKKVTVTTNGNPRKTRLLIKGEVVE